MLSELRPNCVAQFNLFDYEVPHVGSEALMSLMDTMNRSGPYSIGFARGQRNRSGLEDETKDAESRMDDKQERTACS
nr:hypothetical protein [Candidatus Pantoea persica]